MWEDFKAFAFQGNVLELAVAVIIGGAFGKIVSSLVENIFTPLIGMLFNGIYFEDLSYKGITYGVFIQSVFDFFVIAISIFLFIRLLTKLKREKAEEEEEVEEEIEPQEALLTEIRDLLKEQNKN